MRATAISVSIRYSRPLADGSHKTIELSCEAILTNSNEDWKEAQATLYGELGEQMRKVFFANGNHAQAAHRNDTQPAQASTPPPDRHHWCRKHGTEFKRYSKGGKVWFAHRANDGWCNEARKQKRGG